jgi:hypothetical protein
VRRWRRCASRPPFDPCLAEDWEQGDDDDDNEENDADENDNDDEEASDVMQGAMIISTEGCALWFWLVVTGPNAGEIWTDRRADGEPPEELVDENDEPMTFGVWYERWLSESESKWLLNS